MSEKWIRFYKPSDKFFEFSNFYVHRVPLVIDGLEYKTVEHYFQSQKYSENIGKNHEFMRLIISQNTPCQAKMLANPNGTKCRWPWQVKLKEIGDSYQRTTCFNQVEWDKKRDLVMWNGLAAKFTQDKHCRDVLMSTGQSILSEDTSRDNYWGNGGIKTNIGKLGVLLMNIRDSLRQ